MWRRLNLCPDNGTTLQPCNSSRVIVRYHALIGIHCNLICLLDFLPSLLRYPTLCLPSPLPYWNLYICFLPYWNLYISFLTNLYISFLPYWNLNLSLLPYWNLYISFLSYWNLYISFLPYWNLYISFLPYWNLYISFLPCWNLYISFLTYWNLYISFLPYWNLYLSLLPYLTPKFSFSNLHRIPSPQRSSVFFPSTNFPMPPPSIRPPSVSGLP